MVRLEQIIFNYRTTEMWWQFHIDTKTVSEAHCTYGSCELARSSENFNAKMFLDEAARKCCFLIASNGISRVGIRGACCLSLMVLEAVSLLTTRLGT